MALTVRTRLCLPVALTWFAACATGGTVTDAGPVAVDDVEAGIFEAVVDYVPRLGHGLEVRIDPRPLWGDPAAADRDPDDFADVDPAVVDRRSAVLRERGITPVDIRDRELCSGAGGLQPAPPARQPAQQPFVCVAVGLSRGARDTDSATARRAVRVMVVGPGRFTVADVTVSSDGVAWTVAAHRILTDVRS